MTTEERFPEALTVAQLSELLSTLPKDLKVAMTCDSNCVSEAITGLLKIKDGVAFLNTSGN